MVDISWKTLETAKFILWWYTRIFHVTELWACYRVFEHSEISPQTMVDLKPDYSGYWINHLKSVAGERDGEGFGDDKMAIKIFCLNIISH